MHERDYPGQPPRWHDSGHDPAERRGCACSTGSWHWRVTSAPGSADTAYDFKLDQWGISQGPGGIGRGVQSTSGTRAMLWQQARYLAVPTCGPRARARLERVVFRGRAIRSITSAGVHAIRCQGPRGRGYRPASGMNLALLPVSLAISKLHLRSPRATVAARLCNEAWWPNDGVVNTVSMSGPKLGSKDRDDQPGLPRGYALTTRASGTSWA